MLDIKTNSYGALGYDVVLIFTLRLFIL